MQKSGPTRTIHRWQGIVWEGGGANALYLMQNKDHIGSISLLS